MEQQANQALVFTPYTEHTSVSNIQAWDIVTAASTQINEFVKHVV